jgi:hypothetical protein
MISKYTTDDLRARADYLYDKMAGDTVAMLSWAADVIDAANTVIEEYRTKEFLSIQPTKEIEMDIIEAIEVLRMEGWVAAADRLQVLLGLLPAV